jgi:hypothetical protein
LYFFSDFLVLISFSVFLLTLGDVTASLKMCAFIIVGILVWRVVSYITLWPLLFHRAFYFSNEFLTSLFKDNGFDVEELGLCCKKVENRSREKVMNR